MYVSSSTLFRTLTHFYISSCPKIDIFGPTWRFIAPGWSHLQIGSVFNLAIFSSFLARTVQPDTARPESDQMNVRMWRQLRVVQPRCSGAPAPVNYLQLVVFPRKVQNLGFTGARCYWSLGYGSWGNFIGRIMPRIRRDNFHQRRRNLSNETVVTFTQANLTQNIIVYWVQQYKSMAPWFFIGVFGGGA